MTGIMWSSLPCFSSWWLEWYSLLFQQPGHQTMMKHEPFSHRLPSSHSDWMHEGVGTTFLSMFLISTHGWVGWGINHSKEKNAKSSWDSTSPLHKPRQLFILNPLLVFGWEGRKSVSRREREISIWKSYLKEIFSILFYFLPALVPRCLSHHGVRTELTFMDTEITYYHIKMQRGKEKYWAKRNRSWC